MVKLIQDKKRQNERFPVELPVEFRAKQRTVEAMVANIGTGGMCVRTSDVLPVKSHSFFKITSRDRAINFNIEAEVMWAQPQSRIRQRRNKRPGMMGLKFVKSRFFTDETISGIIKQADRGELTVQIA